MAKSKKKLVRNFSVNALLLGVAVVIPEAEINLRAETTEETTESSSKSRASETWQLTGEETRNFGEKNKPSSTYSSEYVYTYVSNLGNKKEIVVYSSKYVYDVNGILSNKEDMIRDLTVSEEKLNIRNIAYDSNGKTLKDESYTTVDGEKVFEDIKEYAYDSNGMQIKKKLFKRDGEWIEEDSIVTSNVDSNGKPYTYEIRNEYFEGTNVLSSKNESLVVGLRKYPVYEETYHEENGKLKSKVEVTYPNGYSDIARYDLSSWEYTLDGSLLKKVEQKKYYGSNYINTTEYKNGKKRKYTKEKFGSNNENTTDVTNYDENEIIIDNRYVSSDGEEEYRTYKKGMIATYTEKWGKENFKKYVYHEGTENYKSMEGNYSSSNGWRATENISYDIYGRIISKNYVEYEGTEITTTKESVKYNSNDGDEGTHIVEEFNKYNVKTYMSKIVNEIDGGYRSLFNTYNSDGKLVESKEYYNKKELYESAETTYTAAGVKIKKNSVNSNSKEDFYISKEITYNSNGTIKEEKENHHTYKRIKTKEMFLINTIAMEKGHLATN